MSDKPALTLLGFEVQRLTVNPGDVLILHAPEPLSHPQRVNATDGVRALLAEAGFPDMPFIVLERGWRFSVIEKADLLRAGLTADELAEAGRGV